MSEITGVDPGVADRGELAVTWETPPPDGANHTTVDVPVIVSTYPGVEGGSVVIVVVGPVEISKLSAAPTDDSPVPPFVTGTIPSTISGVVVSVPMVTERGESALTDVTVPVVGVVHVSALPAPFAVNT